MHSPKEAKMVSMKESKYLFTECTTALAEIAKLT